MTKSILKRHSGVSVASSTSENDSASQEDSLKAKRVSFDGAEPARVFQADEWDRSPAEVTLRLTYKDVVELRDLDVSLVRTGSLMMERTPSRRPTRQRTPLHPPTQPSEPSPSSLASPTVTGHILRDGSIPRPSSPISTPPSPRLSPLPPLMEDASATSMSTEPGRGPPASDSGFIFHSMPASGSPPGLPVRSPRLKALSSPALAPPSPLTLSSPLFPPSPGPKPSSRPMASIPVILHHRSGSMSPRLKKQSTTDSQKPLVLPALTRRASVPDELILQARKGTISQSTLSGDDGLSAKWKPLCLAGMDANSSSVSSSSGKIAPSSSPATSSSKSWRNGRSLVGWELKRNGGGSGKLGFGLVRKGTTGA